MTDCRDLDVRPVRPDDWSLVEALFGERGACGGCWCMEWRRKGTRAERTRHKGDFNRRAFQALLEAGRVHGCLAIADGSAVGWCSLGPRAEFPSLLASRALASGAPEDAWAVTCFYVDRRWRGRGVATRLLAEAVEAARGAGARVIEGYPASRPRAGGPLPAAFAWTGTPPLFEAAGFERVVPCVLTRPVYRRTLGG